MNWEIPDVQVGFRKGRGIRDQIADICLLIEKVREFQKKKIYFLFADNSKAFECRDHSNCGKFFKRCEYQTTLPASWETYMQVKKKQLDMEQWLVQNWERSMSKQSIVILLT